MFRLQNRLLACVFLSAGIGTVLTLFAPGVVFGASELPANYDDPAKSLVNPASQAVDPVGSNERDAIDALEKTSPGNANPPHASQKQQPSQVEDDAPGPIQVDKTFRVPGVRIPALEPHQNLGGLRMNQGKLQNVNLEGANLFNAKLVRARLSAANLRHANLAKAQLQGADMKNADLQNAQLTFANLTSAKLNDADMRGASLRWADLRRAHLLNVNLSGATLLGAHLEGADLTGANISGVHFMMARYSSRTLFPPGFNPHRHGMIFSEITHFARGARVTQPRPML